MISPLNSNTTIRLAGIVRESIVDGPGMRFTVFVQGCPHHCPECHNPQTHDFNGGSLSSIEKIYEEFIKNPMLSGITLSGGEPIDQAENLLPLAKAVVEYGKDVVIFSGYTIEQLLEMGKARPAILELLSISRLLIDGRFEADQKDLTLVFRGSKNQRLIDPKKSVLQQKAVLYPQ